MSFSESFAYNIGIMINIPILMVLSILTTLIAFFVVMAIYNTLIKSTSKKYWWFILIGLAILYMIAFYIYFHIH